MKKAEIMNTLTRKFYRVGFKFKKHSPEILVGAGVVGVVASAVMACKATTNWTMFWQRRKIQLTKFMM